MSTILTLERVAVAEKVAKKVNSVAVMELLIKSSSAEGGNLSWKCRIKFFNLIQLTKILMWFIAPEQLDLQKGLCVNYVTMTGDILTRLKLLKLRLK